MLPTVLNQTVESQNSSIIKDKIPGTLDGHLLPVIGWLLAGLAYLVLPQKHFYDCKLHGSKFQSSVEIPYRYNGVITQPVLNRKVVPVAAWTKFIFGSMYFFLDVLFAGIQSMDTKRQLPHLQHDTIAFTFIMSGFVDLLCVWPKTCWLLPSCVDYVFFSVTFFTEVLQFVTHLNGRTPVDVRLHQLQASIAAMTILNLAGEACFRKRPEFPVMRGLLITLQATWMFHLILILYHPMGLKPWDLHSEDNVELVSLLFLLHTILLAWLALTINLLFVSSFRSAIKKKKISRDVMPLMIMASTR